MVVAKNPRPHRTRSPKPALPETLPITSRLVESHICSCAVEVPPGVARTLAPALVRYCICNSSSLQLLAGPAGPGLVLTSPPAAASPDDPSTSSTHPAYYAPTTPAIMSGAVATARPTQALRARRESQRPGIARVVTKTPTMEDDSAKPEPKQFGMHSPPGLLHYARACS
jgi:hypothetical protein